MIVSIKANGDIYNIKPMIVYQGSSEVNQLYLFAPLASGSVVNVTFTLPNLTTTQSYLLTLQTPISDSLNAWYVDIPVVATQYVGIVKVNFSITLADGSTLTVNRTQFEVKRGDDVVLPDEPDADVYTQILEALAQVQTDYATKVDIDYTDTETETEQQIINNVNGLKLIKTVGTTTVTFEVTENGIEIDGVEINANIDAKIEEHNTSETAHADIRQDISDIIDGTTVVAEATHAIHADIADMNSAFNVSDTIADIAITDIFESDGKTAKKSTSDASGNNIVSTYATKTELNQAVTGAVIYKGIWDTTGQTDYSSLNSYRPIKSGWRFECNGIGCTIDDIEYKSGDFITFNQDVDISTTILTSMIDKTDNTDLVTSVNGQQGTVILDADDISDTETINKFATIEQLTQIATNTGNITDLELYKLDNYYYQQLNNPANTVVDILIPPYTSGTFELYLESGSGKNTEILWGDGDSQYITSWGTVQHTYWTGSSNTNYESKKIVIVGGNLSNTPQLYINGEGIGNDDATRYVGVRYSNLLTTVIEKAFDGCSNLIYCDLPDSITSIYNYAFRKCSKLKNIIIPKNVTILGLGYGVFQECTSLEKIEIPGGIERLYYDGFAECSNLRQVIFNDGLLSLNSYYVFNNCINLREIQLPSTITNIGQYAFGGCSNLSKLTCLALTPPTLSSTTFTGSGITSTTGYIYVPYSEDHSVLTAYKTATNWSTYADRIFEYIDGDLITEIKSDIATKEPLLPSEPTEQENKYLSWDGLGNKIWKNVSVGTSGYSANLYFTPDASTVESTYNQLSYILPSTETIRSFAVTGEEILAETYLFDTQLGITLLDSGPWSSNIYAYVSASSGNTYIRLEVFKRDSSGIETILFYETSNDINNTTAQWIRISSNQQNFIVDETDRLGVRVYVSTDSEAEKTVYYYVGGNFAAYVNTPIALRHSQLRDLNGDNNYLHLTLAEKTQIATNTSDISNLDANKADVATTLSGYGITDAYTKTEIDSKISSVYKYKGSVATYGDLPSTGLTIGDVYNVEDTGDNYAWTGTVWDKLAGTIDLSNYLAKDNTTEFTPTGDYNPATKKYVDDADALKISISSIVNDLTTGGTAVPLSAEQGKTLNTNKLDKTTSGSIRRTYGINASNEQELTEIDTTPTASSTNLVTSGGIKSYVDNKVSSVTSVYTTITLSSSGWASNEQTESVTFDDGDTLKILLPTLSTTALTLANNSAYANANIIVSSTDYSADTVTFYAETVPTVDITLIVEVS